MDRRTMTKGVAWTLPAITIAAAAPGLAASPRVEGYAEKCPGVADVPEGFPKHGYVIHLTITPEPTTVTPISVLLGNGKFAEIVSTSPFVVDAGSSPSKLTVTVDVDGTIHEVDIKAFPHCS